jgi:hypothetical protein
MKDIGNLIEINQKKGLPRKYKFNAFIRWTTLILATAAVLYAIWVIFYKLNEDSPQFFKFVPFIIIFLAANSIMRNLFSLNAIIFTCEDIRFKFLARRTVVIPWKSIFKITMGQRRQRAINIFYREAGTEKKFLMQLSFPNMLEIINSIAALCENVEYDEFLNSVLVTDKEKAEHSSEK